MSYNGAISLKKGDASNKVSRVALGSVRMILLLAVAFIMVLPFVWMLSSSLKYDKEIFTYPTKWIPEVFRWANYQEVWTRISFPTFYLNTIKLAAIITAGQLLTCSLAAYAFAKLNFPGRDKLFLGYLGTMMIPWHAIMIPQFIIIKTLGLYGTHWSLILLQVFSVFGVFLLRQFMLSIPMELSQAARIDGCNEFGIYSKIILPLSKPGLATLTVFTFNFIWNDYLGPLIYLSEERLKTIQLGLTYFKSIYKMEYGLIMAGTVSSLLPIIIIYAFAQRYLIEGIAFSGLKG